VKWPWSKKKNEAAETNTFSIELALESERADLAVSDWLSRMYHHRDQIPSEVLNGYVVDRFLSEVNHGGLLGFFEWEFEFVPAAVVALKDAGLADIAAVLQDAMHIVSGETWFATREDFDNAKPLLLDEGRLEELDQLVIEASRKIEDAMHHYIRANLKTFSALDAKET